MNTLTQTQSSNEWHVIKGEAQFGPYTYSEMIKMMQDKLLFGFDFVWSPHLEAWTSASEVPEFSSDRLTRLVMEKDTADAFNRRSSPRYAVSVPVFCHDNLKLWNGTCENLSSGGALILMENPVLLPGNLLTLHFRASQKDERSFNCTAEILSKRLTKQRIQHDTGIHYAVKFVQMNPEAEAQVQAWMKQKEIKK